MALRKREPAASFRLDAAALYWELDRKRQQRGLTLEETAAAVNASYSTLACWRRGGGMTGDVALRVALFLNCDLRLFAAPPDPPPASRGEAA